MEFLTNEDFKSLNEIDDLIDARFVKKILAERESLAKEAQQLRQQIHAFTTKCENVCSTSRLKEMLKL